MLLCLRTYLQELSEWMKSVENGVAISLTLSEIVINNIVTVPVFISSSFRVRGIHLLDSMEDGTEMVAPDPFLSLDAPATEDLESHAHSNEYVVSLFSPLPSSCICIL